MIRLDTEFARTHSWRKAMNSTRSAVEAIPRRLRRLRAASAAPRSRAGRDPASPRRVPDGLGVARSRGSGPSPLTSQPTVTPAACANATSRSRLGSASPRNHLRNAEGETPVARASRSALGQRRRMICSRPMNAAVRRYPRLPVETVVADSLRRDICRPPLKVPTLSGQGLDPLDAFRRSNRHFPIAILWREMP